ncbi:MAG TPA: NADP-dependent glyceraldehyde-3-phosphate dehydrogenase [bacterium]|nr:NADP-dependent glyceraldehyde-3-phosphate dehydrogenase [bacterium]HQG44205.1 NADP-dependent glyceraldehyde-3-phosphate dehydrogenase [bacterium]HQI47724.1 NADP-dependent glyceraldehyde-3-phosphate dehydrogenase [bacterium]HQJ64085.1 NADP-dependent glyceraldehyde-3-phosphate dehydrogenase [bacterium]
MNPLFPSSFYPAPESIPESFRFAGPIEQRSWLCGGEIRTWEGLQQPVFSPVCEPGAGEPRRKLLGSYPLMTGAASLQALEAAVRAWDQGQGEWPTMPVAERISRVASFSARMQERRGEIVKRLMWEIGKSQVDSEKEFDRTVEYIRNTIAALKELDRVSSRFVIEEGVIGQIRRSPLGVVLCMGPFNYPLNETFTTLIPALIMGNPVLFKPPKLGVLLFEPLLAAFQECFPAGVINTVYGDGATIVGPLMESGRVDVLAFIGTSRVADILRKQHPKPHRLRCVLGLDAKNPAVILKDADLDLAVKECVLGALSFNGQRCTALKMIFVHEEVREAFLGKLTAAVGALKCGMPWEAGVQITPLPEEGKTSRLLELIQDAVEKGARVVNEGGGTVNATCMFPAIVYPVRAGMRLYTEEQFGPILPVASFRTIDEPLQYIAESNYGQQVSLFGSDPAVLAGLIDPLVNQVCRVNLNSQCQRGPDTFPFTGRKDSAEGTLSVSDALRVFTIRALVAAKESAVNQQIIKTIVTERKSQFLSTDFIF